MRKIICMAFMMLSGVATSANAGSASGYITGLNTEAGSAKFYVTNGHADGPGCAVSQRWAVDITTPAGQTMWSTILTAYSQHKNVQVGGTANCNVWGDSETVAWIQLPIEL